MHLIVGRARTGKTTFAQQQNWTIFDAPGYNDEIDRKYLRTQECLNRIIEFNHNNPEESDRTCIIVQRLKDAPPAIRNNCTIWRSADDGTHNFVEE